MITAKERVFKELIQKAHEYGAADAVVIPAGKIVTIDDLAERCKIPQCESYGLSGNCPPYHSGPAGFRKFVKHFNHAVFFRIDLPADIFYSSDRIELFHLLHLAASGIEKAALDAGFPEAKAFAGGACKKLFCADYPECAVISGEGDCRNPDNARPSLSGFGVSVPDLYKAAGWPVNIKGMSSICGLVLIDSKPDYIKKQGE